MASEKKDEKNIKDNPESEQDDENSNEDGLRDKGSKLMTLAKRRGFFWISNEIYGGSAGFYDYGPLGSRLENRIIEKWREIFVVREGFAEISTPLITPEVVFEASGHIKEFTDLMVECEKCAEPYRADHLLTELHPNPDNLKADEVDGLILKNNIKCQTCGGKISKAYPFNLMFKTSIGPGGKRIGYLRPETAQGMFVNFHLLYRYFREKLPFGVVQIGHAFRNEISPRQGMVRLREFRMAELEYFVDPDNKTHPDFANIKDLVLPLLPSENQGNEDTMEILKISLESALEKKIICNETLCYFIGLTYNFLKSIGLQDSVIRFRQHNEFEMAHYAEDCWDAEILTSYGWLECVGIADRSAYDLSQHNKASGYNLSASVHYENPVENEVRKIILNQKELGKKYRELAKKIKTAVERLTADDVPEDNEPLKVVIDDKSMEIDVSCFEIKLVKEKVFGQKIIPHVIEPSFGIGRILLGLLENSYYENDKGFRVLGLKPGISPFDAGVFPLMAKPELISKTKSCIDILKKKKLLVYYDEAGSIGRRYARMDETGTPFCITIDYDTLDKDTVTIRERDTANQIRIPVSDLGVIMADLIESDLSFSDIKGV